MDRLSDASHVRDEAIDRQPMGNPVTQEGETVENERRKVVHLEVYFSDRLLCEPAILDLSRDSSVSMRILRRRITGSAAWLEFKLSGSVSRVEALVRQSREWGVLTWRIQRGTSCAS